MRPKNFPGRVEKRRQEAIKRQFLYAARKYMVSESDLKRVTHSLKKFSDSAVDAVRAMQEFTDAWKAREGERCV